MKTSKSARVLLADQGHLREALDRRAEAIQREPLTLTRYIQLGDIASLHYQLSQGSEVDPARVPWLDELLGGRNGNA